ncbi:MAG: hypothetical protein CBD11_00950 [Phycisphaera sp. TMED151]|nr:MAG: hypothetical protein CBD11_00950 [Phycisphaera sp. TMED151]RPG10724.1 MAG: AAA family ATPase [Phycisphaera sp. TMED24]|tara:strand:- start:2851 stop:3645 length:795 start_codon:yes stop_codon:yes gene_type:complete
MGTNWTHVYRPKNLDDIIYHDKIRTVLKNKEYPINIIFNGPNGTGKTSLALLFAKKINYPYLYLNCYEESWDDIFIKVIIFQDSLSLTHPHISKKIVIFDNLNELSLERQHNIYKILSKSYFFIICNHCHHIIELIRSKFIELFIELIPKELIYNRVKEICLLENKIIPNIEEISSSIRQAITIAQFQPPSIKKTLPDELKFENLIDLKTTIAELQKHDAIDDLYSEYYKDDIEFLVKLEEIEFNLYSSIPLLASMLLIHKNSQ